jgi:hypothetical protein
MEISAWAKKDKLNCKSRKEVDVGQIISDLVPECPVGGEGTFILTELGTSGCVHCVTSIHLQVGVR